MLNYFWKIVFYELADACRRILFHNCGNWSDRFDLVVDEGPDVIHVDKIDLAWLKKEFGSRVCINGNVGSTTTLMLGTPGGVKKEMTLLWDYMVMPKRGNCLICRATVMVAIWIGY